MVGLRPGGEGFEEGLEARKKKMKMRTRVAEKRSKRGLMGFSFFQALAMENWKTSGKSLGLPGRIGDFLGK